MSSLRDLCFALCSHEVDILRAQRIMGSFYLNYPQINAVENSMREAILKRFSQLKVK